MKPILLGLWLLVLPLYSWAAIDTYQFSDEAKREQFQKITHELRCPKCQNQDIADSNSPIAGDMRREIYRMLEKGQTEDQIVGFMVARYGDFVRYKPVVAERTWVLWYGPVVLIGIGLIAVLLVARLRKKPKEEPEVAGDERQRLDNILKDYEEN